MNNPKNTLEKISIYQSQEDLSPICILIDGVSDFSNFEYDIQNLFGPELTLKNGFDNKVLLIFDATVEFIDSKIQKYFEIHNYDAYSIFIKDSLACNVINKFNNINQQLFYLYYENNSQIMIMPKHPQNYQDFKSISSYPFKFLYGFNNFSDLVAFYCNIITNNENWPIFAFLPSNSMNHQNERIEIMNSKKLASISKSYYPKFSPFKALYYVSFIEKMPNKPQRILNSNLIYGIQKVNDAQISHIFNKSKSNKFNEFVIRTFLGFENKFRCLHVFDYFIHHSNENKFSFFDVSLVNDEINNPKVNVRYDLFYLEFKSLIDPTLMFSINNVDSFNFKNFNDFSTFLSFDNYDDFAVAKNLISSSVYKDIDYAFKSFKFVDKDEFGLLFPKQKKVLQSYSSISFLIFRIHKIKENVTPDLKSFTANASIIIQNEICSLDNKPYCIIGLINNEKREETFQLLSKLKCSNAYLKSYFPDGKEIPTKTQETEASNDNQFEEDEINDDENESIANDDDDDDDDDQIQTENSLNDDQKTKNKAEIVKVKDIKPTFPENEIDDQFDFNIRKESLAPKKFEIQEYLELMNQIYNIIMNFIEKVEYEEKDYKKLIQFFKDPKISENTQILRETFYIVLHICNYHYRTSFFIQRIEKILLMFKESLKKHFKNQEIFSIFEVNKRILLILIEQKSLIIDQQIADIMANENHRSNDYHYYFFPEIKQFINEEIKKETESMINAENKSIKIFKQKRQIGENDSDICQIIRKDSLDEFKSELAKNNFDYDDILVTSEFETNPCLINNKLTLIQYAAFFGSIKIFKDYLKQTNEIDSSLMLYAIHGNNLEMISLIIKNITQLQTIINVNIFISESIKCHHNEITNYFIRITDTKLNNKNFGNAIKYHNFAFFPNSFENKYFIKLCKHNYVILVDILLNSQDAKIKFLLIFNEILFK